MSEFFDYKYNFVYFQDNIINMQFEIELFIK